MEGALLEPLLRAVRRALWRDAFAAAARRAAWSSAGLGLAAAGCHRWVVSLPPGALPALLLVPWLLAFCLACVRRPDDVACARFADRGLGGASAYTTWLEQQDAAPSPARQHLRRWVAGRVPASLQELAARSAPLHLARPMSALAVCGAFAALVLARPGSAPPAAPAEQSVAPAGSTVAALPATAADLSTELARALRADPAPQAPQRGAAGAGARDGAAASSARAGATPGPGGPAVPLSGTQAAAPVTAGVSPPGPAAMAAARATDASATGREAGDSRDAGGSGRARAAAAAAALHGRAMPAAAGGATIADDARAGRFDLADAAPTSVLPLPVAAPARPPAATDAAALTPSQARYLQAWRQAQR